MPSPRVVRHSAVAVSVYGLTNPLPYGFFVAAMLMDLIYAKTATILWVKSAAWLITFGLILAIIPRLMNLVRVWVIARGSSTAMARTDFWLNLIAIVAAIINAFVHSRDAYATMPAGLWLSITTVVLMAAGNVMLALQAATDSEHAHG